MCRRWSTSWRDAGRRRAASPAGVTTQRGHGTGAPGCTRLLTRALLALALLLVPLAGRPMAPAATIAICAAEGGVKQVPDPAAPAAPAHVHCDACLIAPPALPVPPAGLGLPRAIGLAWATAPSGRPGPLALPPEQARAPPAA